MVRRMLFLCCLGAIGLVAEQVVHNPVHEAAVRVQLNEVRAGSMSSEQYCTIIFADRRFHSEKATRSRGKDVDRKIYEGELAQADWDRVSEILERKDFLELNVPLGVPPLVIEDAHTITISVARGAKFQNMEFLDNKSRKPYDSQLMPLLQWWKAFRRERRPQSEAPPNSHCSLDSNRGIFSR